MNNSIQNSLRYMVWFGLCMVAVPALAWASASTSISVNWGLLAMNLLGGLALFLFGLEMLADALKMMAGDRMRLILASEPVSKGLGKFKLPKIR